MSEQQFLGRKSLMADVARIQAMFGTLYGGGGTVKICGDGIEIVASTTFADSRSYKFVDASGDVVARLGAVHDDTVSDYRSVDMRTLPHAGLASVAWVVADAPTGEIAQTNIEAKLNSAYARSATMLCDVSAASSVQWAIDDVWRATIDATEISAGLRGSATAGTDVRLQADWEVTYDTSIRAAKTDIAPWQADRAKFMELKPSSYKSVTKPDGPPIVGLIAEDVEKTMPHMANYLAQRGPDGKPDMADLRLAGWDDKQMMATMISMIQQQQRDIEALNARVAALEAKTKADGDAIG